MSPDNDLMTQHTGHAPAVPDPDSEPSAEWGWHGGFPRGSMIAGWCTALILVAMVVTHASGGHQEGHVADVYLIVISVALILLLIRRSVRARHSWRD